MSAKSVTGVVNSRMYWLVISVRGEAISIGAFTVASCTASEVSSSASTVTSSATEATVSGKDNAALESALTVTFFSCVENPVAATCTVYVPVGSPEMENFPSGPLTAVRSAFVALVTAMVAPGIA